MTNTNSILNWNSLMMDAFLKNLMILSMWFIPIWTSTNLSEYLTWSFIWSKNNSLTATAARTCRTFPLRGIRRDELDDLLTNKLISFNYLSIRNLKDKLFCFHLFLPQKITLFGDSCFFFQWTVIRSCGNWGVIRKFIPLISRGIIFDHWNEYFQHFKFKFFSN